MTEIGARPDAADESSQTKGKAKAGAGQAKEKAKEGVQQAKGQVQETAQQAKGQARDRVRQQVDQRSVQAGDQARSMATAMRRTGEQLRTEGQEGPANIVEQVADRAERLGSYLSDTNADRILNDVEDFARRQPWAVVFGGATLGFVASRFLKASSSRRFESRDGERWRTMDYDRGYVSPADRTLGPGPSMEPPLATPPVATPPVTTPTAPPPVEPGVA